MFNQIINRLFAIMFSVALSACTGGLGAPGQGGVNINICNLADTDGGCTQSGTNSNVSQTAIDGDAVDDATREAADLARDILGIEGAENPPPGGGTPPPGGGTPPPGGGGTQFPALKLEVADITPGGAGNPNLEDVTPYAISAAGAWKLERESPFSEYDSAPILFVAGDNGTVFRWTPGGAAQGAADDNPNLWYEQAEDEPLLKSLAGTPDPDKPHTYRGIFAYSYVDKHPDPTLDDEFVAAIAVGSSEEPNDGGVSVNDGIVANGRGGTSALNWEPGDWTVENSNENDLLLDVEFRAVWASQYPTAGDDDTTLQVAVGTSGSASSSIIVRRLTINEISPPAGDYDEESDPISGVTLNAVHGHVQSDGLLTVVAVGKTNASSAGHIRRLQGYNPLVTSPSATWVNITPSNITLSELTGVYVANSKAIVAVSKTGQIATCLTDDTIPGNSCAWTVETPASGVSFKAVTGFWARDPAVFLPTLQYHPSSIYYPLYTIAVGDNGAVFRSTYFDQASQGKWTRITPLQLATAYVESIGLLGDSMAIAAALADLGLLDSVGITLSSFTDTRGAIPEFAVDSYVLGSIKSSTEGTPFVVQIREHLPLIDLLGDNQTLVNLLLAALSNANPSGASE